MLLFDEVRTVQAHIPLRLRGIQGDFVGTLDATASPLFAPDGRCGQTQLKIAGIFFYFSIFIALVLAFRITH